MADPVAPAADTPAPPPAPTQGTPAPAATTATAAAPPPVPAPATGDPAVKAAEPPPAAPTASTGRKTAATGDGEDGTEDPAPVSAFPDDWREQMAGGDKAAMTLLGRYASPAAAAKAMVEMRRKISAGAVGKEKPGDDATPEEVAAWKAEQGIPPTPDSYMEKLKLDDGVILSDVDKQLAQGFFKHAHALDWDQKRVNEAMAWYTRFNMDQQAARSDADTDHAADVVRSLKEEMGPVGYKRALAATNALRTPDIEGEAGTLNEILETYRGPDGRLLGNDPRMTRLLINAALEVNPAARASPNNPNMDAKGLTARIAEIEAIQADPVRHVEYDRNPALRQEFRELLAARDKLASRAA